MRISEKSNIINHDGRFYLLKLYYKKRILSYYKLKKNTEIQSKFIFVI